MEAVLIKIDVNDHLVDSNIDLADLVDEHDDDLVDDSLVDDDLFDDDFVDDDLVDSNVDENCSDKSFNCHYTSLLGQTNGRKFEL